MSWSSVHTKCMLLLILVVVIVAAIVEVCYFCLCQKRLVNCHVWQVGKGMVRDCCYPFQPFVPGKTRKSCKPLVIDSGFRISQKFLHVFNCEVFWLHVENVGAWHGMNGIAGREMSDHRGHSACTNKWRRILHHCECQECGLRSSHLPYSLYFRQVSFPTSVNTGCMLLNVYSFGFCWQKKRNCPDHCVRHWRRLNGLINDVGFLFKIMESILIL